MRRGRYWRNNRITAVDIKTRASAAKTSEPRDDDAMFKSFSHFTWAEVLSLCKKCFQVAIL